jgi:Arc/MetJ-type ribon-helix-helix transcriptional regulator
MREKYNVFMRTISITLPLKLIKFMDRMIEEGKASDYSDVLHQAIQKFSADQAVQDVLEAEKGPFLSGNLCELAKVIH